MTEFDAPVAVPGSPLARVDPLAKLCAALFTVVAVSTFPAAVQWRHAAVLAVLVALWAGSRVPARYVLRRFLAATPFIAMAAALPLASGVPDGLLLSLAVAWKAYSAILLLSMLAATTAMADLIESLRRLGAPRGVALTAILMQRYLFVLLEEWRRIARARECRTGGRLKTGRVRVWANQAAMVFVRGWERAERVAQAMLLRGFRGEFPRLGARRARALDVALGFSLPLAVLVLRIA